MQMGRTLFLALSVSGVLAAALLFVVVRWVLPRPAEEAPAPRYTIGAWEGQVAVFEGEKRHPKQVFDVAVSTLPEELRHRLAQGVPAESEAQLSVLLEDYVG